MNDELDTTVLVTVDGPFGTHTFVSGTMHASEAAMTATHYKPGDTIECKVLAVRAQRSKDAT